MHPCRLSPNQVCFSPHSRLPIPAAPCYAWVWTCAVDLAAYCLKHHVITVCTRKAASRIACVVFGVRPRCRLPKIFATAHNGGGTGDPLSVDDTGHQDDSTYWWDCRRTLRIQAVAAPLAAQQLTGQTDSQSLRPRRDMRPLAGAVYAPSAAPRTCSGCARACACAGLCVHTSLLCPSLCAGGRPRVQQADEQRASAGVELRPTVVLADDEGGSIALALRRVQVQGNALHAMNCTALCLFISFHVISSWHGWRWRPARWRITPQYMHVCSCAVRCAVRCAALCCRQRWSSRARQRVWRWQASMELQRC